MSILAGPPLWGSTNMWGANAAAFVPRISNIALDGQTIDVNIENGVFDAPIALRNGANSALTFDLEGADLGRPYFVGKPGPFRNLPPDARIFVGAQYVALYCDSLAPIKNAVFRSKAPTGHVLAVVPPSGLGFDLDGGRVQVTLLLEDIVDGPFAMLWGLTILPALFAATAT